MKVQELQVQTEQWSSTSTWRCFFWPFSIAAAGTPDDFRTELHSQKTRSKNQGSFILIEPYGGV